MADESASGLKSLDSALGVLTYMARRDGPLTLSEIARDCDMPPSKVHRYLSSFVAAGLMRQEGRSGRYDLGPEAMQIGLGAIARNDFVNRTADGLPDLAARTQMTALLAVWGNGGATVVRWERGVSPTVTSMGLGTNLPLLNSATGRVFLAWGPPLMIRDAQASALRSAARNPALLPDISPTRADVARLTGDIRARGYASVDGQFIPGLVAIAAPVLDWQDEVQTAVTLVGIDPDSVSVLETPYSVENGAAAMERLMSGPHRPTAVICGNDVLAVGAVRAAKRMGLRVPGDVSVTGFDDIEIAQIVEPPLTTVHVPHRQMGTRAAQMIVSLLHGGPHAPAEPLETHIVDRASLGPAPQS